MNSKTYSSAYSQIYLPEIEEKVQNLSSMEFKWLKILRQMSREDLESLKKQLRKHQSLLKEIKKQNEQQKNDES
ncbi:unnamed protein product [Paramecium sonneborni]|uniref:Uncharacterized protein n=1 Tax=Paramecium sonneborni TaxID=65129 RepID=A0A8S1MQL0_9CILI|nr:unnamed protein product [Paramecium sonneborni]